MKCLVVSLCVLFSTIVHAQDFYDLENIQTIEVTFAESNWDQLMDAAYAADAGYILAQSVTINGVEFDSVGVKYKGNSTYQANQVKNPWHIELDTYKDHEYDGFTDIKLANGSKDPSMLRDVLAYQILRQYMDAPEANFANLYVNGTLIGLYSNTESISKKFMKKRFGSNDNTRFKCSPPDGAGPQTNDYPNLVYLGQDSTDYYDSYELKSDDGWQELIDLCDTLTNHTDAIEEILDVDRALWMLAFDNVIVNLDSYIGAFSQNYYLYRSDFGRFLSVVWDLNESFGVFSSTGTSSLDNTTSKQQMTHLLHENDSGFPLIQQLLSVPMYKRMYLAHIKTILLENFENNSYYDSGLSLQAIIAESVQTDKNKFFTYNNFIDNLTSDIGGGGGGPGGGRSSTPGIANLMNARSAYLLGLTDFTTAEPTIGNIIISSESPMVDEMVSISASISDEREVYLGYRTHDIAPFNRVEMLDDGAHNDGAANDGVYGTTVEITDEFTQFYIYAENENIGKFSPQRAEHEYYTITAIETNANAGDVVINEFMASNDGVVADQDGDFDDWIELYNNTTVSIDLSGYFLSDDATDLTQWAFPNGTTIEPNGYLIVWADDDEDQEGFHANFKLSTSGETIFLTDDAGAVIDEVSFAEQTTDVSYARIPNGIGEFQMSSATFNSSNDDGIDCTSMGGDMDNDGICADEDCNDNDPAIGAIQPMGSVCDDGDAATINDVIQLDGCSCAGTQIKSTDLVINEFMASNDNTSVDQDGEFDDWIELYNNGTSNLDISGYFLTDDASELALWTFPSGTIIEAQGYLIVWADDDEDQEGLHAYFKLSTSGESLILSDRDSSIIDAIDFSEQTTDISYGRYPNGTGDFKTMNPTFGEENMETVTNTEDIISGDISITAYPNPADDSFYLKINEIEQKERLVSIFNLDGKTMYKSTFFGNMNIDVSTWETGVYVIKVENEFFKIIVF